jgi:hypothetical protein
MFSKRNWSYNLRKEIRRGVSGSGNLTIYLKIYSFTGALRERARLSHFRP